MRTELARLAGVAAALAVLAAGCGGLSAAPIRIGVLTDCHGAFSSFYDSTVAGAELPLLERGAKLRGKRPSDGVEGASVAGKPVELVIGCEGGTFGTMLAEARRLVEQVGVDVVVGPLAVPYGLVLGEYARRQPSTVFSIAVSGEPATTLRQRAPNVFRFGLDDAQSMAGLGSYAYHELGWRTAAVIGEDDPFGWSEVSGFVAEFCSLGGKIAKRIWSPSFSSNLSRLVGEIPPGADGVLLGDGSQAVNSFFDAYGKPHPDLARHVVVGDFVLFLATLDQRLAGVVAGGPFPVERTAPAWTRYVREFKRWFPGVLGVTGFDLGYYSATEPVLEALEQVHGDISDGERKLMAALAKIRLDAPNGPIRLDRNHQAIGPNFLVRVEKDAAGRFGVRTFRVVPNVEESFNGYFTSTTPEPSRTQPACVKREPPPWAR
jgi:branched-chain amino acid transport system substrate-binding protein